MSGYAEEYHPESKIDSLEWQAPKYEEFDFKSSDASLSGKLLSGVLTGEELEDALHRLAQVAAVSGSVSARCTLAIFGGISVKDGSLMRQVINSDVDSIPTNIERLILLKAREHKRNGDNAKSLALYAVVGCYPPEYGDTVPCLESPTANPYYDSQALFMNDTAYFDQIGAIGNGG